MFIPIKLTARLVLLDLQKMDPDAKMTLANQDNSFTLNDKYVKIAVQWPDV